MTSGAGEGRAAAAFGLLAAAAMVMATAAPAQTVDGRDINRERVGPNSGPPPLPPFAPPSPAPSPPLLAAAPAVREGELLIRDVYVGGDAGAYPPRPSREWTLPPADTSGLHLVREPGESLDQVWVRRQFTANGMIGATVGYDRIAALIQLVNVAYVRSGFINSGVVLLPQAPGAGDGLLRLKLVSGHLVAGVGGGPVMVVWKDGHARGLSPDYVRDRMAAARMNPLDVAQVERDFRLLADDPAIGTVNTELRPGERPGEATMVVTVAPPPRFDLYGEASNSRSPSVGGNRFSVGGSIRNALAAGDVLAGEVGTTKGLTDVVGSYSAPFLDPAIQFVVRGGFNDAAVVDRPLVPLDISSKEWSVEGGLRATVFAKPLTPIAGSETPSPAESLEAGLLIVHHRLISRLLGVPFSFSPGSDDGVTEYSAMRLTADYTRRTAASVFAASLTASLGLDGTLPDDRGVAHPSPNFVSVVAQANFARRLTRHLLELRLRLAGQASGGLLYSPERISIGGFDTVRGYRENLVLADEAAIGSVELAQPLSFRGRRSTRGIDWTSITPSIFADGAIAHNRAAPQPIPHRIYSAGASLAWTPAPWLSARVSYAKALDHIDTPGRRDLQDRGFQFRVVFHPLPLIFGSRAT